MNEWMDCTTIGSNYEQQIDAYSSRMRHRPLKLRYPLGFEFGEERGYGEWKDGSAPN